MLLELGFIRRRGFSIAEDVFASESCIPRKKNCETIFRGQFYPEGSINLLLLVVQCFLIINLKVHACSILGTVFVTRSTFFL